MRTPPKGRQFQKGKSGNPGGRPKIPADVREIARQYTMDAMNALAQIVKNRKASPGARTAAAQALLDRGYGRPTQHVEANVSLLDKMSDAEQRSLAAALTALARDEGDAAGGTPATHH